MDTRDREAIDGLFTRIGDIERQAGPRDAEAERLIADHAQRQPAATYYLAQTVVMQDLALKSLQARVDELEKAAKAVPEASEGGGFFSRTAPAGSPVSSAARTSVPGVGARGPWGLAEPQPGAHSPTPAPQAYTPQPPYPQPSAPAQQGFGGLGGGRSGGGGFLAGAAQTAMGVAGGVVLGNALGSMLGGHGGLFGGGAGLFGGGAGPTEVTETVTNNIYEAPQDDVREASDTIPADDPASDAGYQDASYDDPGVDDGLSGDDSGFEDV